MIVLGCTGGPCALAVAAAGQATPHPDALLPCCGQVRRTFELLKSVAPCILFIDEFDALGMARGADKEGGGGACLVFCLQVTALKRRQARTPCMPGHSIAFHKACEPSSLRCDCFELAATAPLPLGSAAQPAAKQLSTRWQQQADGGAACAAANEGEPVLCRQGSVPRGVYVGR